MCLSSSPVFMWGVLFAQTQLLFLCIVALKVKRCQETKAAEVATKKFISSFSCLLIFFPCDGGNNNLSPFPPCIFQVFLLYYVLLFLIYFTYLLFLTFSYLLSIATLLPLPCAAHKTILPYTLLLPCCLFLH